MYKKVLVAAFLLVGLVLSSNANAQLFGRRGNCSSGNCGQYNGVSEAQALAQALSLGTGQFQASPLVIQTNPSTSAVAKAEVRKDAPRVAVAPLAIIPLEVAPLPVGPQVAVQGTPTILAVPVPVAVQEQPRRLRRPRREVSISKAKAVTVNTNRPALNGW